MSEERRRRRRRRRSMINSGRRRRRRRRCIEKELEADVRYVLQRGTSECPSDHQPPLLQLE